MVAQPSTIAVIGGGISGLTAAYELRKKLGPAARIIVIESSAQVGGKLKTRPGANGPLEAGAEAYLAFRHDATEFFKELGLADQLVAPSGLPSKLYIGGELKDLPRNTVTGIPGSSEGLGYLLSEASLAKIDAESNPELTPALHWVLGDDMNVGQLVAARLGEEVVDRIVSPLLGGVYSTTAYDLGLRATIPQLAAALDEMASAGDHVSLTGAVQRVLEARKQAQQARLSSEAATDSTKTKRPVVFQTFRDGFEVLYNTLVDESAAELLLSTKATGLRQHDNGFEVTVELPSESGTSISTIDVDGVVVAAPSATTSELLSNLAPEAAELIGGVDTSNSAVVGMCFDSSEGLPEINGVLCEIGADLSAKAFTVSSRKWPHIGERYGAVVRASFGRFDDDSHVHRSDEDLIARAKADLAKATGFDAEPTAVFVQRWWAGIPRFDMGHGGLMDFARQDLAEVPKLAATGAWLSGPGIPECISNAKAAASKIAAELA